MSVEERFFLVRKGTEMYTVEKWFDGQEWVYIVLDPNGKSIGMTFLKLENAKKVAEIRTKYHDKPMEYLNMVEEIENFFAATNN